MKVKASSPNSKERLLDAFSKNIDSPIKTRLAIEKATIKNPIISAFVFVDTFIVTYNSLLL